MVAGILPQGHDVCSSEDEIIIIIIIFRYQQHRHFQQFFVLYELSRISYFSVCIVFYFLGWPASCPAGSVQSLAKTSLRGIPISSGLLSGLPEGCGLRQAGCRVASLSWLSSCKPVMAVRQTSCLPSYNPFIDMALTTFMAML